MKTKLLLIALLFAGLQLGSNAAVTVDQTTSKEYLLNSGYSDALSESINVGHAKAVGEQYYTPAEQKYRNSSAWSRFWKRTYSYIDPAADDYSFFHHDLANHKFFQVG